jgi:four helix bundle protein
MMSEKDEAARVDREPKTEDGRALSDAPRYKFQRLEVYQLALDYVDIVYQLTKRLPASENRNLRSQLERAVTSIVLNIAEGSTGQTDAEQARFLGLAIRSFMESVACLDQIQRHRYAEAHELRDVRDSGHRVFIKLQAMRRSLNKTTRPPSAVPDQDVAASPRSPVIGQDNYE